jgi:hypothetical protein
MKNLSLAFVLLLSSMAMAQDSLQTNLFDTVKSLKFSLFDLVEPTSRSVLLGYEFHLSPNFSLLSEAGPVFGKYEGEQSRGIKIREELRWLLLPAPKKRSYIGVQYVYKKWKAEGLNDEFFLYKVYNSAYYDYDYMRRVDALHLTLGCLNNTFGKLLIDFGIFGGVRRLTTKAIGVPKDWKLYIEYADDLILPEDIYYNLGAPSQKIIPSLGAYFRIGFRVK